MEELLNEGMFYISSEKTVKGEREIWVKAGKIPMVYERKDGDFRLLDTVGGVAKLKKCSLPTVRMIEAYVGHPSVQDNESTVPAWLWVGLVVMVVASILMVTQTMEAYGSPLERTKCVDIKGQCISRTKIVSPDKRVTFLNVKLGESECKDVVEFCPLERWKSAVENDGRVREVGEGCLMVGMNQVCNPEYLDLQWWRLSDR